MAQLGVIGKAERIVHHGEPFLLVELRVQNVRMVARPDGSANSIRVGDGGASYLPIRFACDAMTLDATGARHKPHGLSLCSEPTTIPTPFATPLFVVFRYPAPGPAKVSIPVTVFPPGTPIATRRDASPPATQTATYDHLLGDRELVLQVLVPERKR